MRGLIRQHWAGIFIAISVLVLAQVAWWALVFTQNVQLIAALRMGNAHQAAVASGGPLNPDVVRAIREEEIRSKTMFLSESLFFALLTSLGLYLLYRAINSEKRSREVQRNFIEIVSHESKTPLTALKLRLESLRDKASEPEFREGMRLALEEVRRLAGVLEKTLDLNRSERRALRFEALSLAEVVESVVRRLEPWLSAKQVSVHLDLDRELLVSGDFASLQNSVQSLLENAVLYNTSETRQAQIDVRRQGARAFLAITDNGPGITQEERRRVFDRFYRGVNSGSVGGTGLGLYLARVIVEAHRGVLRVAEGVHSGARFEMELPIEEAV